MMPRSRTAPSAFGAPQQGQHLWILDSAHALRFSPVSTLTVTVAVWLVRSTAFEQFGELAHRRHRHLDVCLQRCPKSVPGECSHASTGLRMPSRRSASASSMVATPVRPRRLRPRAARRGWPP